jgi:hypothetical protein
VRIEILPEARDDLIAGFRFYERQAPGLGSYFRESILTDVDGHWLPMAAFTPKLLDIIRPE